jgi:hypothetical protein
MRLEFSRISCGINELIIGPKEKVTKKALEKLIFDGRSVCAMLITSTKRKNVIKLLECCKFKRVIDKVSGSKSVFLVRRFSREEIALAKRNWKKRYSMND